MKARLHDLSLARDGGYLLTIATRENIGPLFDELHETDVQKLCGGWNKNGIGWQTEVMDSKIDGCKNVVLYYGSSTFDTKQMSRLIDNIVQDCKAVGIKTLTPQQLDALKEDWRCAK